MSLLQIRVNDGVLGYSGCTRRWVWVLGMRATVAHDETEMVRVHKPALWIAFREVAKGASRSRTCLFSTHVRAVVVEAFDAVVALPCP